MEEVTNCLDLGYPVDVRYLDLLKAFDKVRHGRLLLKLEAHGISGNVLRWIENRLCGRKQKVMLGRQVSDWSEVLNGVPQGSVLGPILFVLYINDIDECINSKILKFADDTKISTTCRTVNSLEAIDSLRADLHNLVLWSVDWQMLFNIDKCKVMHLAYNNPVHYVMGTSQLQAATEERDL